MVGYVVVQNTRACKRVYQTSFVVDVGKDVTVVFVVVIDVAGDALSNFDATEEDEFLHVVDAVEGIVVLVVGAKSVVCDLPRMSTTLRWWSVYLSYCHRVRVGLRGRGRR